MGKSSVSYYNLIIKPRRPKHPTHQRSVSDIEGGIGVLGFFKSFLDFQKSRGFIKDEKKQRVLGILRYSSYSRTLLVTTISGSFGEEADLINIDDGSDAGTINENQAAVRESRILLACPKGTDIAQLAIEYRNEADSYLLLCAFKNQLKSIYPDISFQLNKIHETDDWIKNGRLIEISIPLNAITNQLEVASGPDEDSERAVTVGSLSLCIKPPSGAGYIEQGIWDMLPHSGLEKNAYLTVPDVIETKDIKELGASATIEGNNGAKKKFLIGNEKFPTIRELLTEDGEPYYDNPKFKSYVCDAIMIRYRKGGLKLRSDWASLPWDEKEPAETPNWSEDDKNEKDDAKETS